MADLFDSAPPAEPMAPPDRARWPTGCAPVPWRR